MGHINIVIAALVLSSPVFAQEDVVGKGVVSVTASQALEWHRTSQNYIARGDAVLRQDDTMLKADIITAHYEEIEDSEEIGDIDLLNALGNVHLQLGEQHFYAQRANFDVLANNATLVGGNLRYVSNEYEVTATDTMEYWGADNLVIARGNAVIKQGPDTIMSDTLSAYLTDKRDLEKLEAHDNVVVKRENETVFADRAVYQVASDKAMLYGNVRIVRGNIDLMGDQAEINFKSGASRLIASPDDAKPSRVRGLFFLGNEGQ